MPFQSSLFVKPTQNDMYLNILTFLNPNSFVQLLQLANFLNTETIQNQEESLTLAQSLDEIQRESNDIFSAENTYLSAKVERMNGGLTNVCFKLETPKNTFFLRIPGKGSEEHISRQDEDYNIKVARSRGLNIHIHFFNAKTGLYVGEFIKNATAFNPNILKSRKAMGDVAHILRHLHTCPTLFQNNCDIFTRLRDLLQKIDGYNHTLLHDRAQLDNTLALLAGICAQDHSELVPCHNDPTYLNFLYNEQQRLILLDWEYAGNYKALFDLANFAMASFLSKECERWLLEAYYHHAPNETILQCFEAYKLLTHIWYYLWAELQLANNSNVVPEEELISLANTHWEAIMSKGEFLLHKTCQNNMQ